MDVQTFVDGGWGGFLAVLLGAAGLIASLAWGWRERAVVMERRTYFGFAATRAYQIGFVWMILRGWMPDTWLRCLPVALVVPALDVSLFVALLAVLIRALGASFSPGWDWRVGLRQFVYFLLPAMLGSELYGDVRALPAEWWFLAGVEAVLLLPFALRLGYRAEVALLEVVS